MEQQIFIDTRMLIAIPKILIFLYDSSSCLTMQFSTNNITKFINTLTIMVQFNNITCFKHECLINQYRLCYVSGKREELIK